MKPYYDHAGIQIFLGDCREIQGKKKNDVIRDALYEKVEQCNAKPKG
jgi:hypothetical protein